MPNATKEDVAQRVNEALVEFGADADAIAPDARFEALDVDSLDLVELAQIAEDDYGVELKTEDLQRIETVGQAVDLIAERAG
ncbi:MAG TPA: phosphopantetheine-binding protein [Thermoleophilaceae bacterium]|nr:phosphopantetheine-binding protein [Thermoleophilaceae bacterium]